MRMRAAATKPMMPYSTAWLWFSTYGDTARFMLAYTPLSRFVSDAAFAMTSDGVSAVRCWACGSSRLVLAGAGADAGAAAGAGLGFVATVATVGFGCGFITGFVVGFGAATGAGAVWMRIVDWVMSASPTRPRGPAPAWSGAGGACRR